MKKPTKWLYAQRRLWSAWALAQSDQFSLCAQWVAKEPSFLHADSEDSDQPGCTWHFVGFVMRWLILGILGQWKMIFKGQEQQWNIIWVQKDFVLQQDLPLRHYWERKMLCNTDASAYTITWAASWPNQQNYLCFPTKTQISLGIRPVWSVFDVRSMGS